MLDSSPRTENFLKYMHVGHILHWQWAPIADRQLQKNNIDLAISVHGNFQSIYRTEKFLKIFIL